MTVIQDGEARHYQGEAEVENEEAEEQRFNTLEKKIRRICSVLHDDDPEMNRSTSNYCVTMDKGYGSLAEHLPSSLPTSLIHLRGRPLRLDWIIMLE